MEKTTKTTTNAGKPIQTEKERQEDALRRKKLGLPTIKPPFMEKDR